MIEIELSNWANEYARSEDEAINWREPPQRLSALESVSRLRKLQLRSFNETDIGITASDRRKVFVAANLCNLISGGDFIHSLARGFTLRASTSRRQSACCEQSLCYQRANHTPTALIYSITPSEPSLENKIFSRGLFRRSHWSDFKTRISVFLGDRICLDCARDICNL